MNKFNLQFLTPRFPDPLCITHEIIYDRLYLFVQEILNIIMEYSKMNNVNY